MVCIYCGGITRITNSRVQKKTNQTWRRRKCLNCYQTYTTIEKFSDTSSLTVINTKNNLSPFSRDKLFISILNSCGHRQDKIEISGYLTDTIISKLLNKIENGSLKSSSIKETSLVTLERFDKASMTYYQAYYID